MHTYSTLNELSWGELLAELKTPFASPLTRHLPIQPAGSPDLIHVDCALNVARRRIWPGLSILDPEQCRTSREMLGWILQFALDDPPFVPDLRATRMSLSEGGLPLATAAYLAWELLYRFEYACMPDAEDPAQGVISVRIRVKNTGVVAQRAHVRAKLNLQRDCDLFEYHYVPFHWDAVKWLPCDRVRLSGDDLITEAGAIGRICPGGFASVWEEEACFAADSHNKRHFGDSPHYVPPERRLARIDHAVHFAKDLAPGEEASFSLLVLSDIEGATDGHRQRLHRADHATVTALAARHFRAQLPAGGASLRFPTGRWDELFTAMQLSTLQLLIRFPGEKTLMPTQGGSSERHFVWVWEAVWMLRPLLRLGYDQPVRDAIGFIFSLQDGGHPPRGRITSQAGAIGTTGPGWLNTTGAGLGLAVEYAAYTHDAGFLREYLPRMLRAADWIAGELRATRRLEADGSRPPWYGLMPFGCGTDGDIGYVVAFTDAYTFWGLEKLARLLATLGHARAAEFAAVVAEYRQDLARAIAVLAQPDGRIDRAIRTRKVEGPTSLTLEHLSDASQESLSPKFEHLVNASHLAYCGLLPVGEPLFQRFMEHTEKAIANGFFMAPMDGDVMYMGINEMLWQDFYLRLGEWKKAHATLAVNLRYGMTQDTFLVQERFSTSMPEFTPWQPNGSGNGRVLQMLLNALYCEHDDLVTVLGGIPGSWLRRNRETALRDLRTLRGRVSLEVSMSDDRHGTICLSADSAAALPRRIRFPDHLHCQAVSAAITLEGDIFQVGGDPVSVAFTLCLQDPG